MRSNQGFTIVELVIAMALFIGVIIISTSAFESIIKTSGRIITSEESNIEGLVGLEMFRHDLQQMGFGLPTAFKTTPAYQEAVQGPASLNDSTSSVPRAVVSWENLSAYGDYIAVKGTSVGSSKTSQKWTYRTYTSAAKVWPTGADNLKASSYVVILDRTFSKTGTLVNTMVNSSSTDWKTFDKTSSAPTDVSQTNFIYGVTDPSGSLPNGIRMPFNRADYYVTRPASASSIPAGCAPDTGILYKAGINHADGTRTEYPLVDCVADMQVVFGWDAAGDGVITESSAYDSTSANISVSGTATSSEVQALMTNPEEIRNKLKYVKVYVMVQDGRKDTGFKNSSKIVVGDLESITKGYDVTALTNKGWLNYRWKIYRMVVRPRNLTGN